MVDFPKYESYKDSGVEWLGEIPSHWDVKKLKFMVRLKNGQDYKNFEVQEPGYPVIGSGGRFAYASKYLFEGESVLLGRKGTIDKPLYVNGAFWTVDTMFYSKIYSNTFPKFFYYCASTIPFGYYSTNTAVPSMTQEALGNHIFTYPSIEEQKRIVEFLDRKTSEIDQAIAQKQRLIELLQEQKAILINQAVTKGLDPNVPMCDRGVEWIGEIPAHWDLRKLKHIARVRLSNVDKHSKPRETPVRLCNYTDVYYRDFIADDIDFMAATATANQISDFILEQGDVLITKDSESPNDIAVPAYVAQSFNDVICGYHLAHIKPIYIEGIYLFRAFQAKNISSQFKISANGITRYGISKSVISDALFLVPPIEEQNKIVIFLNRKTSEIDQVIAHEQRFIKLLQEQKTILISQAVTGKLKV